MVRCINDIAAAASAIDQNQTASQSASTTIAAGLPLASDVVRFYDVRFDLVCADSGLVLHALPPQANALHAAGDADTAPEGQR